MKPFYSYFSRILVLIALLFVGSGCASFGKKLKAFLGGDPNATATANNKNPAKPSGPRFSDQQNYMQGPKRAYKRMTKERMRQSEQLDSNAGSLWAMEGQGAFLFAENIVRMVGDPIPVKLEGEPKQQIDAKVSLISKFLKKIEDRKAQNMKRLAEESKQADKDKAREPAAKTADKADGEKGKDGPAEAENTDFNIQTVPARVVERMVDGNYRIKGSQPFMVGRREYKVIVAGVVRPEDFNDEGVNSSKLIDSKFDIVSAKKREGEE